MLYVEILVKNLPSLRTLRMKHVWIFQHKSDHKPTPQITQEWPHKKHFVVLKVPMQYLVLHPIKTISVEEVEILCCPAKTPKHHSS